MTRVAAPTTTDRTPPSVSMPLRDKLSAVRSFHTAGETFRDTTGPVALTKLAPTWVMPPLVWVSSPAGAHDTLAAPAEVMSKETPIVMQTRMLIGTNLFTLNDVPWQPMRRSLQPVFTKHRVRAFGGDMSAAAQALTEGWADGATVDLDRECRTVTIDALARTVLGCRLDDHDEFGRDIRRLITLASDRSSRPVNTPYWLPTPTNRHAHAASTRLHERAAEIVARCRAHPDTDAPLVHALMAAHDPDTGEPLTDDAIADQLVVFLIAGHDTTATTLAYSLWQLGRHPHMQDEVRREARACGSGTLTPENIGDLGYTMQVLHESLRLCPPGAIIARTAVDDVWIDGYLVAAGTVVIVSIYAIHRDPDLWDRPLRFDPDRFQHAAMKGLDRWQYLPFGGGRRSCIGDHFAMLEATLALATIIRDTEILSHRDDFPMEVPFTTVAAEPVMATVHR